MSHRKLSREARASLLARFPPDGYVLVTVMDQTIGFIEDAKWATTVHREATVYPTHADALEARHNYIANWKENLAGSIDDPATDPSARAYQAQLSARAGEDGDPWIEAVQVLAHFIDRPDTW